MKYIKEYAFSALAILMASCSSDSDTIEPEAQKTPVASSNTMSFSASIESGEAASKATRTSLADANTTSPYPIWSSNDQIKVLNTATSDARLFSINSSDVGKRAANFTGEIKVETGNNANNKFYAFYAGNVGASTGAPTISMSGSNVTVSGTIPSVQSSTPAFNPNLHFMTACTTGSAFSFKNGMALLKVSITENVANNYQICRIRFKANKASEKIVGDFTATISDSGTLTNYTVTNGSNEVTIGDGKTSLTVGDYYISILPCAFSEGFTLAFEDEDDNGKDNLVVYDRIKETAFNVSASEIINLGSYTAKECAKEAYVDLGITRTIDGVTKKILWCIDNIYDEAGETITGSNGTTTLSDQNQSYYAWGETYVKSNQYKDSYCQNYSWYYDYSIGEGSSASDEAKHIEKRSYKYGIGNGNWDDAWESSNRWQFTTSTKGVLIKYNSSSSYVGSITDWNGGKTDIKTELDVEDDAAYQKTNGRLRIPSEADYLALKQAFADGKLTKSGVGSAARGQLYRFTNKSTGYFLNFYAKGYNYKTSSDDAAPIKKNGEIAYYWTRNRNTDDASYSYKARVFAVDSYDGNSGQNVMSLDRCAGCLIRGVIYR